VYLGISQPRFARVKRLERSNSVRAVASPWVALELLAHVASPLDPHFKRSQAALRRLAEHCETYNGARYVLNFVGDVSHQLAHAVLLRDVSKDSNVDNLASFISAAISDESHHPANEAGWTEIAERVREIEQSFVDNVWNNVIRSSIPDADSWTALSKSPRQLQEALAELRSPNTLRIFAVDFLQRAAKIDGSKESIVPEQAVERILSQCGGALLLEVSLFSKVIAQGLDLTKSKHRNTVWDIYIAVATMMFGHLDTRPMWLITNDRLVQRGAAAAAIASRIISLDHYENLLKDHHQFLEAVAAS
jgi:hypothetical protein